MTKIIRLEDESPRLIFRKSSIAFGVFDGVHVGHRFLIDEARRTAREVGGHSVALSFSIDPDEMFAPDRLVKLMTNEERIAALASSGVDAVAIIPFDAGTARLAPMEFLNWAFGRETPAFVHVGEGFRFGARASGDASDMRAWGSDKGLRVCEHALRELLGAPVSSTRIRKLYADGLDAEAETLLGGRRLMSGETPRMAT